MTTLNDDNDDDVTPTFLLPSQASENQRHINRLLSLSAAVAAVYRQSTDVNNDDDSSYSEDECHPGRANTLETRKANCIRREPSGF